VRARAHVRDRQREGKQVFLQEREIARDRERAWRGSAGERGNERWIEQARGKGERERR